MAGPDDSYVDEVIRAIFHWKDAKKPRKVGPFGAFIDARILADFDYFRRYWGVACAGVSPAT
mgnify:CR=1 FL=1